MEDGNLSQSERIILSILSEETRDMTTDEVRASAVKRLIQCPDSTIAFLNRLRIKKKVKGAFSKDRKGWVWSLENA